MKPTKSILILLSLFLMFSCDDNSVEPLVCDEGLTDVDGECIYICEEGITECHYQGDIDVLQDFIDVNESLSGEEPLEIGSQLWIDGRLEWLRLLSNQLTTLPESIGDLSSLEKLWLSSNQLTTLPESIGDLSSLEDLSLTINQLTTLPESIGNLSSLEFLGLSSNQLTSLPESIGNLSSLRILFVSHNQLTTFPESFCNLSMDWGVENEWSPYSLLISNNQLCSDIPTCIVDYIGEQDCDD